ncbi:MAG: NADH-quinone oxidoreductase subunit F, partial [bacterium]|nr:NADH-quinone oxidoreductase subunit F [bacterium]
MAKPKLLVGLGSCGIAAGGQIVYNYLTEQADMEIIDIGVTSCIGMCYAEPLVEVVDGEERILFGNVDSSFAGEILAGLASGTLPKENRVREDDDGKEYLRKQVKVALRNCGVIDPESLDEYRAAGGYSAISKCLTDMSPEEVITVITESGLAGRGGGFFPTGMKWSFLAKAAGTPKYLVCNADEGDPGAFMDRAMLEGD